MQFQGSPCPPRKPRIIAEGCAPSETSAGLVSRFVRGVLFVRYFVVDSDVGKLNFRSIVAVVSLLPRLDRSGGGGNGRPVIECSAVFVDSDREWKLDSDRLSSVSVDRD